MAAPYPPEGNQTPHTERPLKVYGEQYVTAGELPIGAVINPEPIPGLPMFTDGLPRVPLSTGWMIVALTDWVISSRYTGKPIEVISAEEFAERFGPSE